MRSLLILLGMLAALLFVIVAVGAWLLVMARTRAIDKLRARRARSGPQMVDERAIEGLASGGPDAASEVIDAARGLVNEATREPARR